MEAIAVITDGAWLTRGGDAHGVDNLVRGGGDVEDGVELEDRLLHHVLDDFLRLVIGLLVTEPDAHRGAGEGGGGEEEREDGCAEELHLECW